MRDFKLQSLGKTPDFERTVNNFREILKLAASNAFVIS